MTKEPITGRFTLRIEKGKRVFSVECRSCKATVKLPDRTFADSAADSWLDIPCPKCGKSAREVHDAKP